MLEILLESQRRRLVLLIATIANGLYLPTFTRHTSTFLVEAS